MNIYVGDSVRFKDGSFTLTLKQGSNKLTSEHEGLRKELCKVIAINISFPTDIEKSQDVLQYQNNCLVLAPNGDLIFCSKINIEKVS